MSEFFVPKIKMIVTYDIQPAALEPYQQFVVAELVPGMQEMGLYMIEAWHTAYGQYPLRQAGFVAEDMGTLQDALASSQWSELEARFLTFIRNYNYKIVRFRDGFQF